MEHPAGQIALEPPALGHPFYDAWMRCCYTDDLTQQLRQKVDAFFGSRPYTFKHAFDDRCGFQVILEQVESVPYDIGFLLGDIIHNMRATLDFVAYIACKINGPAGADLDRVQFPIFDRYAAFDKSAVIRELRSRFSDDDIAQIKSLRPASDGLEQFWFLNKLSNIEKHRLPLNLYLDRLSVPYSEITFKKDDGLAVTFLQSPWKVGDVVATSLKAKVLDMYPYLELRMQMPNTDYDIEVFSNIRELAGIVQKTVQLFAIRVTHPDVVMSLPDDLMARPGKVRL